MYGFEAPRSERQQLAFLKREAEAQKRKLEEERAARARAATQAAREAERKERKEKERLAKEARKAERAAKAAERKQEQAQKQARRLQREKAAAAQAKQDEKEEERKKKKQKKDEKGAAAAEAKRRKGAKKSGRSSGGGGGGGKPPSKAQLKAHIRTLIQQVDIKEVTSKGIRKMLEAHFGCKLKPRKDEVKACLMAVLQESQESSSEEEEEEEEEEEDESSEEESSDDEDKPKRKATGGFAMEYILSKQLAEIVGLEAATRGTISKQVWAYVKERDLQDPENKQYIMCDAKLKKLFEGTERIRGFTMSKFFGKHLTKP